MSQWSAYDDAVPHTIGLPDVQRRLAGLRPARLRGGAAEDILGRVGDVVVVAASSRGGSTLFGELLRRTPGLLHLRAETNPLFALAGLGGTASEKRDVVAAELAAEIGRPATGVAADDAGADAVERYA